MKYLMIPVNAVKDASITSGWDQMVELRLECVLSRSTGAKTAEVVGAQIVEEKEGLAFDWQT